MVAPHAHCGYPLRSFEIRQCVQITHLLQPRTNRQLAVTCSWHLIQGLLGVDEPPTLVGGNRIELAAFCSGTNGRREICAIGTWRHLDARSREREKASQSPHMMDWLTSQSQFMIEWPNRVETVGAKFVVFGEISAIIYKLEESLSKIVIEDQNSCRNPKELFW